MSRCWLYHATKDPIIIDDEDYKEYEKEGWKDSPIHFIKLDELGVDPDDPMMVQTFGESIEGVKNSLNGALNIDKMTKKELEVYADEHYSVDLDKKQKIRTLRGQVKALFSGDSGKE